MPLHRPSRGRRNAAAAVLITSGLLLGLHVLSGKELLRAEASDAVQPADLPPAVPLAAVEERPVAPESVHLGRVEAAERVSIRPRVAGHIEAVLFREGQFVKAGQPLFRIDARGYEALAAQARAQLQLAQAREQRATAEALRARELQTVDAMSTEEVDRRLAAAAEARAQVAAARATLQAAELDLEFTTVRAPIDGRIGRALITAGNYVAAGASQGPLATLLSAAAPHVHFDMAESEMQTYLARSRQREPLQVTLFAETSDQPVATARVDFADNEIEPGTGTLRLRARVTSGEDALLPGAYVQVRLASPRARVTLLVPDAAIGTDQGRHHVLVVDSDDVVQYRAVQLGDRHGEQRAITQGVQAGERVVASGLMRVKPGMKVRAADSAARNG